MVSTRATIEQASTLPGFLVYTKQSIVDYTLDDAQLATRCPLDNGRHADTDTSGGGGGGPARQPVGQLDRLPTEILLQVLVRVDVPSLTQFRRVNRRAMELVDAVPEYAALFRHCPDVVRAVVALGADGFDCGALYDTLSSRRCATCDADFGYYLYLVACRRVCWFCFAFRKDYLPFTVGESKTDPNAVTEATLARLSDVPSVLGLPGRYPAPGTNDGAQVAGRLPLYDRKALAARLPSPLPGPSIDAGSRDFRRCMAIITAPFLFDAGRQADWGYFCSGCWGEFDPRGKHLRKKYTRDMMPDHIAKFGPVEEATYVYAGYRHISEETLE